MTTDRRHSGLELPVEELQTVVEDVLVGGVEAGLDTVPHHVGGPGGALELQDLHNGESFEGGADASCAAIIELCVVVITMM